MRGTLLTAGLTVVVLVAACAAGSTDGPTPTPPVVTTATTPSADPTSGSSPATAKASARPSSRPRPDATERRKLNAQLIAAAWDNDRGRARRLIARGADVNAKDNSVQSAYLIATSEGHLELLDLTLQHGADLDAKDSFNGTGLIRAAERGHADIVGRLVAEGIEVDHVNKLGWTALHEAVILGDGSGRYVDTVRVLVAAGADVRRRSARDQITPLDHARSRGHTRVEAVLRASITSDRLPRRQANQQLLTAARTGDATEAALALRSGARLNVRDGRGRTPLLIAVTEDNVAVARLLVHLGADPNALDDRHDTPWLVTGVTGSVDMVEVLLPARPDLTIRNRFGGVSLIPASERGHVAYVRRVVKTSIDVNHVNDLGWTALLEAVVLGDGSQRYQEIVAILLRAGADPTIADRNGATALDHAVRRGHRDVADLLRR